MHPFRCVCPANYSSDSSGLNCVPHCNLYGCSNTSGVCVAPNVCVCNLGFTGADCSVDCGCNGHSTCNAQINQCDSCQNNTAGNHCQNCSVGFFGSPLNGSTCLTCSQACSGHSSMCTTSSQGDVLCHNCADNTMGPQCDVCAPGYFYALSLQASAAKASLTTHQYILAHLGQTKCSPCDCNGHAFTCNSTTGGGCVCIDNTQSPFACTNDASCPGLQCTQCISAVSLIAQNPVVSLQGSPANGRPCYAEMGVENAVYSAVNSTSSDHYELVPVYLNTNIRLYVVVDAGEQTGPDAAVLVYVSRSTNTTINHFASGGQRRKRDSPNGYLVFPQSDVVSFAQVTRGKARIVINVAHFNLVSQRFYVSVTGATPANTTYYIYYTQPNIAINLFVFFSIFFSCFFLFLALLVVYVGARSRAAERVQVRRQEVEMEVRFLCAVLFYELLIDSI